MQEVLTVQVFDEIGGWGFTHGSLVDQLKDFSGNYIHVPVNSFGGSVFEGIAIYNTLLGRKEKVTTTVVGYAMSMGTIIALAGDEVVMPENGYFMIHNPYNGIIGDTDDMAKNAELLEMLTSDLAKIYSKKTGISNSKIRKMMKEETWLNAKMAKEMGFVTKITKGAEFVASFNPNEFKAYTNIPEEIKSKLEMDTNKENAVDVVAELVNIKETVLNAHSEVLGAIATKEDTKPKEDNLGVVLENIQNSHNAILEGYKAKLESLNVKNTELEGVVNELNEKLTASENAIEAANKELEAKSTELAQANEKATADVLAVTNDLEAIKAENEKLLKGFEKKPKETVAKVKEGKITGNSNAGSYASYQEKLQANMPSKN